MVSYLKGPAPPACDILLLSNQHTGVAAAEFAGIAYDDVISGPLSCLGVSLGFVFAEAGTGACVAIVPSLHA